VRLEISRALNRGITVIPVRVGGAELPAKPDLPEDIRGLVDHQAALVTTTGFRNEMAGLARDIRAIPNPWPLKWIAAAVAAAVSVLLVGWVALYQIGLPVWAPWTRPNVSEADKANAEQSKRKADEEAKRKADEEARRTAENDAKAEEEARRTVEERRKHAEAEARREPALAAKPGSGESFRDRLADGQPCPTCPEMVVVPPGDFMMGSPETESGRQSNEGQQHNVKIAAPFAIGRFAVTRGEFAAFVNDTSYKIDAGCIAWTNQPDRTWRSPGFDQDDRYPVVCISWNDAKAFIEWLSTKTGKPYRFLTEAEAEHATRAGTTTRYSFGDDEAALPQFAWYNANSGNRTHPVGEKKPNGFGLFDMHGNAWSWCQDTWHSSYQGAPDDGSAWAGGDMSLRVLRGGAWGSFPSGLRSAIRSWDQPDHRKDVVGFRVARTLLPPNP
jgi:formylglycine-generating enzyme required for sulfatase activity